MAYQQPSCGNALFWHERGRMALELSIQVSSGRAVGKPSDILPRTASYTSKKGRFALARAKP